MVSLSLFPFLHLALQELSVIFVSVCYFFVQIVFLILVIFTIHGPHISLLIVEIFIHSLTSFLIIHLLGEIVSHALLIVFHFLVLHLVVDAILLFFIHFELSNF